MKWMGVTNQEEWRQMLEAGIAWEIIIPDWLPMSLNSLVSNSRSSYMGERRWIQHYLSHNYPAIPPAMDKRGFEMFIAKKSHMDDEPNLDGRSKSILDAMQKLGMLRGDDMKWLEWHHVQQLKGTRKGVMARLWEVGDASQTNIQEAQAS